MEPRRWERLPLAWEAVFGRRAPLVVEVGFGAGEFLEEMARRHPERDFVGFELSLECLQRAQRRLTRRGLGNVRLVRLEARFGLRELFPDGSVEEVIANFPCPWPKKRHRERRLIEEGFVRTLAAVLREGGAFRMTTDQAWYARQGAELFAQGGWFRVEPCPGEAGTRYARKWRSMGRQLYGLVAHKVRPASVERIATGQMPHVRLAAEVNAARVRSLVGMRGEVPGGVFLVREAFAAPGGDAFLLRCFASDGGFAQHYFILVSRTPQGWMVKLDRATVPFRTPAVKRSVFAVGEALEA